MKSLTKTLTLLKWHAYNLIRPFDLLRASALRRVTTQSNTGSTTSTRVHTYLTILVKSLVFDPQAGELHVSGQIAEENRYAKSGSFHTLDLELHRNFTLEKTLDGESEGWDSVARAQLQEACDPGRGAEAVAVVMQEGIANVCLLTQTQTLVKQRVEMSIPRGKRGMGVPKLAKTIHDKTLSKFFKNVLEVLLRQLEALDETKDRGSGLPILIASPGWVAAQFKTYANEEAVRLGDKALMRRVKNDFITVHSSTGHVSALNEVIKSPEVSARLKDTKYARETTLMDEFFTLLRKDDGRAWYGPKECEEAVTKGAVGRGGGVLLISNELFRSQDVGVRRRWVRLVDKVRDDEGGEVRVLSSDHESGKRLEGLGGIATILTFPILEMEEDGDGDDGDDSEDQGRDREGQNGELT